MWSWRKKKKCDLCPNKAEYIKFINGHKYNLCAECREYYNNIKIEITD